MAQWTNARVPPTFTPAADLRRSAAAAASPSQQQQQQQQAQRRSVALDARNLSHSQRAEAAAVRSPATQVGDKLVVFLLLLFATIRRLQRADVPINSAYYALAPHSAFVRNYSAHAYAAGGRPRDQQQVLYSTAAGTLNPTLRRYARARCVSPATSTTSRYFSRQLGPKLSAPTTSGVGYQRYRGSRTSDTSYVLVPPQAPIATTSEPLDGGGYYRYASGPLKRPQPLYHKRREPTAASSRPVSYQVGHSRIWRPTSLRLLQYETYGTLNSDALAPYYHHPSPHSIYAPTYAVAPLAAAAPPPQLAFGTIGRLQRAADKQQQQKEARARINVAYPMYSRLAVKLASFVCAAACLRDRRCIETFALQFLGLITCGLILSPARDSNLAEFFRSTQTEWQVVVVSIVGCLTIVALLLLLTIYCATRHALWRKIVSVASRASARALLTGRFQDIYNSGASSLLYLVCCCIEVRIVDAQLALKRQMRLTGNFARY